VDQPAPPFTLADYTGRPVSLADYRGKQVVLLVFNRSFA
jgi:peroxiredoxin